MKYAGKIWYFYLKKNKKIPYAVTDNEYMAMRFKTERNMKKFKVKEVQLSPEEWLPEINKYDKQRLNVIPINSNLVDNLTIVATVDEEIKLNMKVDEIEKEMERIYKRICVELDIKDKYKYAIEYLTTTSYIDMKNGKELKSTVCLMKVFINLFKDTL